MSMYVCVFAVPRLLTLWFDYGHLVEVNKALMEGIRTIDIDTWLQVIPQLIARIDHPRRLVSQLIHNLLTDVGKQHPQVRGAGLRGRDSDRVWSNTQ